MDKKNQRNAALVREREKYGYTFRELAARFSISHSRPQQIIRAEYRRRRRLYLRAAVVYIQNVQTQWKAHSLNAELDDPSIPAHTARTTKTSGRPNP